MFQLQGPTECQISQIPECNLHAIKYHFVRWKDIYEKVRSFQEIANNENTQKHPLQNLMQANENEKYFLECQMIIMQKIFQFHNANKNSSTKHIFLSFQCNIANNALNDMKKWILTLVLEY